MYLDGVDIATGQLAASRRTAAIGGTCATDGTERLAKQGQLAG